MRGEYNRRLAFLTSTLGSSPHARGIHSHEEELRGAGRFIPACAGNTDRFWRAYAAKQVHPRMRGEYRFGIGSHGGKVGSSPHARGIHGDRVPTIDNARFIPACAGNTEVKDESYVRRQVHPRMRGEYVPLGTTMSFEEGSSPHARGICSKGFDK